MKKIFMPIALLLSAAFVFSGCVRSYSLYYDFDELMQGLVRAEIIYMENRVDFFVVHWYVDVEEINYESVRELRTYPQ